MTGSNVEQKAEQKLAQQCVRQAPEAAADGEKADYKKKAPWSPPVLSKLDLRETRGGFPVLFELGTFIAPPPS